MKIVSSNENGNDLPVFATTAGAASYRVGDEGYVDLIFLRSHFQVDENSSGVDVSGNEKLQQQKAEMVFSKVASVTMSAAQARDLIQAIEHQLQGLAQ